MNNLSTLLIYKPSVAKNVLLKVGVMELSATVLIKLDANVFSKHDSSQAVNFDIFFKYSDSYLHSFIDTEWSFYY